MITKYETESADETFDLLLKKENVKNFSKKDEMFITIPEDTKQIEIAAIFKDSLMMSYVDVNIIKNKLHTKDGKIMLKVKLS